MATIHDRPTRRCSEQTRAERRHGMTGRGRKDHCKRSRETEQSKARRKAQRADLRGTSSNDEVFPATHKSGHKHGMAKFTTSLKTTPSTRATRGGEGSEWCWVQPDHTQPRAAREEACGKRTHGSARGRANSLSESDTEEPWSAMASGSWSAMTTAREERKPLTNQGTTLQKTVCVRRSRGETDALANSDAGKQAQLKTTDWVNTNRWMILMKRSQKSGPTAGRKERTHSG